jgi:hypothetical protein
METRFWSHCGMQTHSKIAIGTATLGDGLANVVHEVFLAGASGRADGLLLELDLRHDVRWGTARWAQWVGEVFRCRGGGDGEVEEAWGEIVWRLSGFGTSRPGCGWRL